MLYIVNNTCLYVYSMFAYAMSQVSCEVLLDYLERSGPL